MSDEQPEPDLRPDDWGSLKSNFLGTASPVRLPEDFEIEDSVLVNPARVKEMMDELATVTDRAYVGVIMAEANPDEGEPEVRPMLAAQTRNFGQLGALCAPCVPTDELEDADR